MLLTLRRDLLLLSFDPAQARAAGLRTRTLHYTLLVALALTIVAALQAVGVLLVTAMLVTPGCTARLLTDRFDRMIGIAITASIFACLAGTYASFRLNASTGACIVLAQTALFLLALAASPKHGIAARTRRQRPAQE